VNAFAGNLGNTARAGWSRIARRIRVPLGFVFAAVYLWLAKPTLWSIATGALIALPGLGLRACASGHVKKNEELTITGPYAYTRNPLYLGSMVIAAGFAVASRNWIVGVILLVLLVVIYLPVIRSEEEFLRNKFADFNVYATQVPRLWPRWSGGKFWYGFSSRLYSQHREYNAAIGTAAMLLALLLKWVWISRGVH
jgi:protein-S-isoprenylcysteine O-methyltransferase Ste14